MTKAFISVAGEDVEKAREVAKEFTANLIYLYDESGQHGVDMWNEEANALRASSVMLIFWSKDYLKKKGTLREIRLAVELLEQRKLGHPIIVRLDDTPLDGRGELQGDESNGVQLLKPLTERWRTLPLPFSAEVVIRSLESLLIDNGMLAPPEFDRTDATKRLTELGQISPRELRPAYWISGYQGYGRRFVVERFMRAFDPNSKKVEVTMSDADGPLAVLLRLSSRGLATPISDLEVLSAACKDGYGGQHETEKVVQAIDAISGRGMHVVIYFEALHADANRWVPQWLLNLMRLLSASRKPKVFFIAQFDFPAALLKDSDLRARTAAFRLPSIEFEEAKTYAYRLTGLFDSNPNRWQPTDIERLADDGQGNLSLLIAIGRYRSLAIDLRIASDQQLDTDHLFAAKINQHLDVCVEQIRNIPDSFELLRVLDDLQLVSFEDLKILFPKADLVTVLNKCLEFGLLEVPNESMYRIPRLILRRLVTRLAFAQGHTSESIGRHERLARLVNSPVRQKPDEPIFERIETRIKSELLSTGESKGQYSKFVTAAYLLHAGIRSYDRQDFAAALKLLRACVRQKEQLPELNTRCVMLRYYGLAAAREDANSDLQKAVELLRAENIEAKKSHARVNPAADAEFVLGFSNRLKEQWFDAIRYYKNSLKYLTDDGGRRIGDCHREMAECCLHLGQSNYADARFHAEQAYKSNDNIMSLDIWVKVLIESVWNDTNLDNVSKAKLEHILDTSLSKLERLSAVLGMGMWHQRKAEDLLQSGEPLDLKSATEHARTALEISHREDFYSLLWRCLVRTNTTQSIAELESSARSAISHQRFNSRTKSIAARYLCAALISKGEIHSAKDILQRNKANFPDGIKRQLEVAISNHSIDSINFV
jgi:tetratricopeptide (TPR) repeat protein